MHYRIFVEAFTLEELTFLENAIRERRVEHARKYAHPATQEEIILAGSEYIQAIKAYRIRTGSSLFVAKAVIDGIRK